MTARLRIIVAALACLMAGTSALAQDSAAPANNSIIGPPQLSNFSLNGTVTRAAPAPAPAKSKAAAVPSKAQSSTPAPKRSEPEPAAPDTRSKTPEPAKTLPEPPADVSANASPAPASQAPAAVPESLPEIPAGSPAATPADGLSLLPWIIAALVAAGAAAWFFFRNRNRNRESYAGLSDFDLAPKGPPEPASPPPAAPSAAAEPKAPPPAAAPAGVISTRLRPQLEIEFRPDRAVVDDNRAAVAFEVSVVNNGTVAARDVLLEASLFNAGPAQDQQIQLFFDNPVGKGDPIPVIPPLKRITVETAVFMARDQVQPIEVEGRSLFVPMVAFNALYRWGGSQGQTSASFLVGKGAKGEKLAPFRLDLGPRIFRGLDAREHELKVRK